MTITYAEYNLKIEINENMVPVLVLEGPEIFEYFTQSFYRQCCGDDGGIVLSDNDVILNLSKNAMIISDYYSLDLNSRKVQNRLYQCMKDIAVDLGKEKDDFTRMGIEIIDRILSSARFDHAEYNLEIDWNDFFKLFQIRMEEDYVTLPEKIIAFIRICAQLLDIELLAFVNLKSYVSVESLLEIYRMAAYLKINLLLIEPVEREALEPEKYYIIDTDKCLIIK